MNDLKDNEAFFNGVSVGILLYQSKVVTAHERKLPIKIGDMVYYIQSSREWLEEMLNRICK